MRLPWSKKKDDRVDPVELSRIAQESLAETRSQQAYVNTITAYLDRRKGQNGFGEDFELTLRPRRAS